MDRDRDRELASLELPALIALFATSINHVLTLCTAALVGNITLIGFAVQTKTFGLVLVGAFVPLTIPAVYIFFGRLFTVMLHSGVAMEEHQHESGNGFFVTLGRVFLSPDGNVKARTLTREAVTPPTILWLYPSLIAFLGQLCLAACLAIWRGWPIA